ncbi:MAG: DUF4249 family protein [Cyclobacteriaceae bacterium]
MKSRCLYQLFASVAKRLKVTLLLSLGIISGCIEPFSAEFSEGAKRLVIEGEITTKPGPYTVKLNQTESLTSFFADTSHFPVRNASVTISDDKGNEEKLFEFRPGVYKTALDGSGIRGTVGHSYILTVITEDDNIFRSAEELITEVPEIDNVDYKFDLATPALLLPTILHPPPRINLIPDSSIHWINRLINPLDYNFRVPENLRHFDSYLIADVRDIINHDLILTPGDIDRNFPLFSNDIISINASAIDIAGAKNYYKWTTNLHFMVKTYPENYALRRSEPIEPDTLRTITIRIEKDCCSECWVSVKYPTVEIATDLYKDGGSINTSLASIPINNFFFQDRVFIEVELSSLSFPAYSFFRGIKKQEDDVGSLFDSAPELIVSNITNTGNPHEVVLGYFNASDSKTSGFYINAEDIRLHFDPNFLWWAIFELPRGRYIYSDDCRTLTNDFLYSVAQKPEWWID